MNLKYKILWVEDDTDWVESEIPFIESHLEKYGFILECKNIEKYENYEFFEFDIIVIDYELADEEQGQDVIEKIRKQELYTEILFYSKYGEKKLRKLISKKQLDGVYCASKDSCREKLKGLIHTTIRKTQDLNNLRGLVMAETSELDEMIKTILKLLAEKDKVEVGKIKERRQKLEEIYANAIKDINKYNLPEAFVKLIKSNHFTAFFSLRTLLSFSKSSKNSLVKKNIEGYEEIQKQRNELAHKNEFEKLKEEDFIKIRKDVQKYKSIFEKIRDKLEI